MVKKKRTDIFNTSNFFCNGVINLFFSFSIMFGIVSDNNLLIVEPIDPDFEFFTDDGIFPTKLLYIF